MGIAERKEKQKTEIRRMILEASMKLFVEQGFENVSIRKIADLIEYSPTTVYLYFKDKNEILFSLHEMGFEKMALYNKDLWNIQNPLMRLYKMGENYIQFGLEYPEYYDLMFIQQAPMETLEESVNCDWDKGEQAMQRLKDTVKECIDMDLIIPRDVDAASMMIWSCVHGLVSLAIRKRFTKIVPEDQMKSMMHQALSALLASLDRTLKK